jgi:hypothetical protein
MSVAQLKALLGPPTKLECPDWLGDGQVVDMTWEFTTAVQVEFASGKAKRWTAAFHDRMPSPVVTHTRSR